MVAGVKPDRPIVRSLLESDLYKFTMLQALLHSHPGAHGEYEFVCRNAPLFPLAQLKEQVEHELDHLCSLTFTGEELAYLRTLRFLKSDFVDFLSLFRFQRRFINVETDGDKLLIRAIGPIVHVMGFEIFVLYIVNELYSRHVANDNERSMRTARDRLAQKVSFLRDQKLPKTFEFFDFGLRRRQSASWQDEYVERLSQWVPQHFRGTSNVYLAKKLGITPFGTMAHEYLQAYQGFGFRLRDFQKSALEGWVQEYRGDLGIALTDTVGMDAFLRDFDLYFARLFDGLRHDSGDPIAWAEKAIAAYTQMRIEPATKRLVFSDSLTFPRAVEIYHHLAGRIASGYGIGTHLSHDSEHPALNVVMKLVLCNGQSVAKVPDSAGKTLCKDEEFLGYLKRVFDIQRAA
jgi:nicotinate phosphoribosyltransferase